MAHRDPFEVLGLPSTASKDEVKARFRELAKKLHPDLSPPGTAAAGFAEVKRAADTILKHGVARHTSKVKDSQDWWKSIHYIPADPAAAAAAAMRQQWRSPVKDSQATWRARSGNRVALFFGLLGLATASGLVGARWMSKAGLGPKYGDGPSPHEESTVFPDMSRRARLIDLIAAERAQIVAKRRAGDGAGSSDTAL